MLSSENCGSSGGGGGVLGCLPALGCRVGGLPGGRVGGLPGCGFEGGGGVYLPGCLPALGGTWGLLGGRPGTLPGFVGFVFGCFLGGGRSSGFLSLPPRGPSGISDSTPPPPGLLILFTLMSCPVSSRILAPTPIVVAATAPNPAPTSPLFGNLPRPRAPRIAVPALPNADCPVVRDTRPVGCASARPPLRKVDISIPSSPACAACLAVALNRGTRIDRAPEAAPLPTADAEDSPAPSAIAL